MRETKEPRRYLTTTQAARRAHVSPSTLLRAVQTKKLKAFSTPGGHFRVDPASLDAFLQSSGMPGEKKKVLLWRMSRQDRETLLEKLTRDADFSLSGEVAGEDKPALIIAGAIVFSALIVAEAIKGLRQEIRHLSGITWDAHLDEQGKLH